MNREISAFSLDAAIPCAVTLWFYVQCAVNDWLYWGLRRSSPSGMWQFLEVELLGSQVAEISKLGFRVSRARMNICSIWHSRVAGFTMQHHAATHQSGPLVSGLLTSVFSVFPQGSEEAKFCLGIVYLFDYNLDFEALPGHEYQRSRHCIWRTEPVQVDRMFRDWEKYADRDFPLSA